MHRLIELQLEIHVSGITGSDACRHYLQRSGPKRHRLGRDKGPTDDQLEVGGWGENEFAARGERFVEAKIELTGARPGPGARYRWSNLERRRRQRGVRGVARSQRSIEDQGEVVDVVRILGGQSGDKTNAALGRRAATKTKDPRHAHDDQNIDDKNDYKDGPEASAGRFHSSPIPKAKLGRRRRVEVSNTNRIEMGIESLRRMKKLRYRSRQGLDRKRDTPTT